MDAFEIIAHRGSSFLAPENTRASVELAWQEGADSVEGDFRLTRDGAVVAMHDDSLLRTTGVDRLLRDCSLADLRELEAGSWKDAQFAGEPIPTLEALLALTPSGNRFYVEVKCGQEIAPALKEVVGNSDLSPDQIIFISLDLPVIAAIKRQISDCPAYWVVDFKRQSDGELFPTVDEMLRLAETHGLDGMDLSAKGPLDGEMIRRLRQAGLDVCVWTVDDPLNARRLIEMGVRGVTTNRPGWLRQQLMA
jgi:glycerophosphoryl diester phosphodiesterase